MVGEIGCSMDPATRIGMTGYGLVRSAWGRGFATEALTVLLEHVLSMPRVDRVVGDAPVDRPASGRVMAKAGMTVVGRRTEERDGVDLLLERYERSA